MARCQLGGLKLLLMNGHTEVLHEESNTIVGNGVVGPLPAEDLLEEALALEALDNHHDLEIGDVTDLLMFGEVSVLLDYDDSLFQ